MNLIESAAKILKSLKLIVYNEQRAMNIHHTKQCDDVAINSPLGTTLAYVFVSF